MLIVQSCKHKKVCGRNDALLNMIQGKFLWYADLNPVCSRACSIMASIQTSGSGSPMQQSPSTIGAMNMKPRIGGIVKFHVC